MKCFLYLALVCFVGQLAAAAPSDSSIDCATFDELLDDRGSAQAITTLNDKYKLSANLDEYTKRCPEMNEAIKTLRKYNKACQSQLTQQVLSAILRTRSNFQDEHCKEGAASFSKASEATACIQENAFDKVKEAERKTILLSQALLDLNIPDEKLRLRRACCGVIESKELFLGATREKCSKYEKEYSEYVDSYMSEAMGLICPDTDKLDCSKLEPLKLEGVEAKSKFFLTPMIKIVKSLDH